MWFGRFFNYLLINLFCLLFLGKAYAKHEGNIHFMKVIRANLKRYTDAPKRIDKTFVVSLIVSALHEEGYRFVKQETSTKRWHKISDSQVHEKTGHTIRDQLKINAKAKKKQAKEAIQQNKVSSGKVKDRLV